MKISVPHYSMTLQITTVGFVRWCLCQKIFREQNNILSILKVLVQWIFGNYQN